MAAARRALIGRDRQAHRRPGAGDRGPAGRAVRARALPARRRARPGQDAADPDAGRRAGADVQPHPVHARPDAGRHHRHRGAGGGPRDRPPRVPVRARADLRATSCWPTRSTARRPRRRRRCCRRCRSTGCRRAGRPTRCRCPFFVFATQNPIEQEGTYPLPEAQLDRFMFQIDVGYPSAEEEVRIVNQMTTGVQAAAAQGAVARAHPGAAGPGAARAGGAARGPARGGAVPRDPTRRARPRPSFVAQVRRRGARGRARRSTWCWRPRRARSCTGATRPPSRTCARWPGRCSCTACCRTSTPRPTGSTRARWSTRLVEAIRPLGAAHGAAH